MWTKIVREAACTGTEFDASPDPDDNGYTTPRYPGARRHLASSISRVSRLLFELSRPVVWQYLRIQSASDAAALAAAPAHLLWSTLRIDVVMSVASDCYPSSSLVTLFRKTPNLVVAHFQNRMRMPSTTGVVEVPGHVFDALRRCKRLHRLEIVGHGEGLHPYLLPVVCRSWPRLRTLKVFPLWFPTTRTPLARPRPRRGTLRFPRLQALCLATCSGNHPGMLAHIDRRVFRAATFPALTALEIHDEDFARVAELIECVGPQLRSLSLPLAMWMHPRRLPTACLDRLRVLTLFVDARQAPVTGNTPRVETLRKLVVAEEKVRGRDGYLKFSMTADRAVRAMDGLTLSRYPRLEVLYFDVVVANAGTLDVDGVRSLQARTVRAVDVIWR